MSIECRKLKEISVIRTGKLDSNASVENGIYPFFTCDPLTLRIDTWAYDTEAVLLAGNNASGNYTAKYYKGKFNAYQRTYIIESADNNLLNTRYLCYAINQQLGLLKTMSSGSTTKFLTIRMLHDLDIPFPDISSQIKIAEIIGSYDDLIENNQRQIKLLEEAAQRLYREWFVDLRFPGHESVRVVDGVPEGWSMQKISEIGEIITGKTPSTNNKDFFGTEIPFVKIPDMHKGIFPLHTETYLSLEGAISQKSKFIPQGSIMISCIATVGLVCISPFKCQTNQQINSIVLKNGVDLYYIFFTMQRLKDLLEGVGSNGATMTNVNKNKFGSLSVLYPSVRLLQMFYNFCKPIFDKIFLLSKNIDYLTESRDIILPKLMSGEMEV